MGRRQGKGGRSPRARERGENPRTTLRNIEVARMGTEPTLPFTRYKAINRLNP